MDIKVGDRVNLPRFGRKNCGVVKYRGILTGIAGSQNKVYLGIELDEPWGKNDGSVGDRRFFTCQQDCGLFVRTKCAVKTRMGPPVTTKKMSVDPNVSRNPDAIGTENAENMPRNIATGGPEEQHGGRKRTSKIPSGKASSKLRKPGAGAPQRPSRSNGARAQLKHEGLGNAPQRGTHRGSPSTEPHTRNSRNITVGNEAEFDDENVGQSGMRKHYSEGSAPDGHQRAPLRTKKSLKAPGSADGRAATGKNRKIRRTFDPTIAKQYRGIKGLKNLGNTCFMNSVLQNINNLSPVRDFFLEPVLCPGEPSNGPREVKEDESKPAETPRNQIRLEKLRLEDQHGSFMNSPMMGTTAGPLTSALGNFIRSMWLNDEPVVVPTNMFNVLCQNVPKFSTKRQQDAVEALRYILDGIDMEAEKKVKQKKKELEEARSGTVAPTNVDGDVPPAPPATPDKDSATAAPGEDEGGTEEKGDGLSAEEIESYGVVAKLFRGELCSEITCSNCGGKSAVQEKFSDISLPLPAKLLKKKMNSPVREGAETRSGLHQCFNHFMAPEGLTDRECDECKSRCDASRKYSIKMAPRVLVIHIKRFAQTMRGFKKLNTFVSYPKQIDIAPYCYEYDDGDHGKTVYTLKGVVVHGGTLHGGHYSAFVKRSPNEWIYMSDSRIRVATESEAMERKGAYILFYSRAHNNEDSKVERVLQGTAGSIADMQRTVVENHISNHIGDSAKGSSGQPVQTFNTPEKEGAGDFPSLLRVGDDCSGNEKSPPAPTPTNYRGKQSLAHMTPTLPTHPNSKSMSGGGRGASTQASAGSRKHVESESNFKHSNSSAVRTNMSATAPAGSTLPVEEILPNLAEARKKLMFLKSRKRVRRQRST
eukprot:g8950.t1